MSSWAARLQTAIDQWRDGDLDGAAGALRAIVVSARDDSGGGAEAVAEASHLLGRLLQESGDLDGARAAHRSVAAGSHPVFAQRSAVALGLMLVDAEEWAEAHRPLRAAAGGADTEIAAMAELTLVTVLRRLGDLDGAAAVLERVRRAADPEVARLAADLDVPRWPEDGGEREREAWEAFESIGALLDEHAEEAEAADEVVLTALNRMLAHGMPALCTAAAFRLYPIYAGRGEFADCRRVMEHAIAVGDPAERGRAEKLLGAALFDLGENAEAREAYRRAAEDHRPEIRLDALIQESKFTRDMDGEEGEREARGILWRVVESGHPEFAVEARACLGQVYSEAGEVEDAVANWRAVLDGVSEYRWGAVHFLGTLLAGLPADDPRRLSVVELLERAGEIDDEPDLAFQARLVLTQAQLAVRGPDEEYERAVDDCDAALERLREGAVDEARALLRRVVDAEITGPSDRAASMLATLEFGEGDPEQADELLEPVADGEDFAGGFGAAVHRLLIAASGAGAPHPVLAALVDYQRLGREIGVARYRECEGHADPAVAALAKSMLGQVYVSLGAAPRSQGVRLLDEAAASGDPLALSHAAVLSWILRDASGASEADEVIGALRRARDGGHPVLAPWVAYALGTALQGRDADGDAGEALDAFEAVSRSGHPGLAAEAEAGALQILEARGDLAGAAAVHERIVARGDRLRAPRSAWLLGFTRVRLDDFDAARAAFALVPEDHPELAVDGVFARRLLDRDFAGAAAVLAGARERGEDHRGAMTAWLALEAAHAWQRAGEHASTDAALSLAIEHGPAVQAQEAALYLGALRGDAGDHAGAAEAWARAAEGEDEGQARRAAGGLGEALFHLGDLDGSADAYRRALDAADPGDEEHTRLLDTVVRVLVAAGRVEEARAVQVDQTGDGPHVALTLGAALRDSGDPDAAAAEFETVLAAAPSDDSMELRAAAMAGVLLARLCDQRGEPARAAEHARRAVTRYERLAEPGRDGAEDAAESLAVAAYELGGYLTATGDDDGARHAYERAAASSDPDIALPAMERLGTASLVERAVLRLRDGDDAGALELLAREYGTPLIAELHVALYHWRLPDVRGLLARAAGAGHAERAADLVSLVAQERLAAGADGSGDLYGLVLDHGTPRQVAEICAAFGHAHWLAGDLDAAVETLERGAAIDDPAALQCLQHLLPVLSVRGDLDALVTAARRAVATADPETAVQGHWALGGVLKDRGDLAGAVAELRAASEQADAVYVPYIQVELGEALHEHGDTEAAHRTMESLLTCDDPVPAVRAGNLLGVWLGQDGRHAGAAEAMGAAAAAALRVPEPDDQVRELHRMALNNLGAVAGMADEAGDAAIAVRALRLAAAGGAPDGAVEIARRYAAEAADRGDLDAARAYYKGAAAFPPAGDRTALLALAELLAERGEPEEARTLLEPLASSDDVAVRMAATALLVPLLKEAGDDGAALEVAARAAGHPVPVPDPVSAGDPAPEPEPESPETGEPADLLSALRERTWKHYEDGDLDEAEALARRSTGTGDPTTVASGHQVLAKILSGRDDLDGAEHAYRQALEAAARIEPDDADLADALQTRLELAHVLQRKGDDGAAKTEAARVRERAAGAGDVVLTAKADSYLGNIMYLGGDMPGALEAFGRVAVLTGPGEPCQFADMISTAANNVMAIAIESGTKGEHALALRGMVLGTRAGFRDSGADVALTVAAQVTGNDPAGIRSFLEAVVGVDAAYDGALHAALATLTSTESDEPEAEEENGPDGADSLLWLMRNQSGKATAGAAGRQLIRAAREIMDDDPAQARRILETVVAYGDPEEIAVAYDDIGDIHGFVEDDMEAAVAAYRKGADVDHPAALVPLRSLLLALADQEDHDAVAETAQRAVTSGDPETVAVGYWLWGDSRGHRGDGDAAVRLYRRGIAAGHPEVTPRIRTDLARTLRERGEPGEAAAEISRAAEAADPEVRARAGTLRGQWAFEDGDLAAAAEALGLVARAEIDPADPEPLSSLAETAAQNLAVVAERAHREGVHEVAGRALALLRSTGEQDAVETARRYATGLAEAGDRAAAMLYVECLAGMLSDPSPDLEIGLADLYVSAGDPERARAIYERLAGHSDAEVRLVANGRLVPLLRRAGDAAGLEGVTRAITGDSAETGLDEGDQAFLGSLLGLLQREQGDHEGALRTLRAAAESGEPTALFSLGQALVDAGEFAEGGEVLARIPETETRYTRHIAVLLARAHHEQRPDRARELYLQAVQGPGDADAHAEALAKMYLGALGKRDRDWPEALRWYRQVIDAGVEGQAPLAAAHLGELAYWLGDRDSAVRYYELTLATGTTKADLVGEAAYRLGEIRHGDGDLDLAREHLRRAAGSGEESFAEQARALLGKLDPEG
ncbi:tetratricopeptide repeat protein [Actinomadura rugatobispora]|uniref:Tetratricopeptide repeat protein n=1 Tax=Actinomadura rugatobispora TaxID=1994 RepID=A0ABW0ZMS7_9ACTN